MGHPSIRDLVAPNINYVRTGQSFQVHKRIIGNVIADKGHEPYT